MTVGCATTHTTDKVDVHLSPETQQAQLYLKNGQYDEAIESYRQIISANPKHFKSVLCQHEIMKATEALSDPYRLIDEIHRTVEMFNTASNESFEGASPKDLEEERKVLFKDIASIGSMFYTVYGVTQKGIYQTFLNNIYEIALNLFPDNKIDSDYTYINAQISSSAEHSEDTDRFYKNDIIDCDYTYTKALFSYHAGHYDDATRLSEVVLDNCDNGKLSNHPGDYIDVSYLNMLSYNELITKLSISNDPSCPIISNDDLEEIPISGCRQNFINACKRYLNVSEKYPGNGHTEPNAYTQFRIARIYYDLNMFEAAIPLFQLMINDAPLSDAAVHACYYIVESYRKRKQYQKLLDYIHEIKNNQDFMSNSTRFMHELILTINSYEEALIEMKNEAGEN